VRIAAAALERARRGVCVDALIVDTDEAVRNVDESHGRKVRLTSYARGPAPPAAPVSWWTPMARQDAVERRHAR